jgi:uncharacterized protein with von Willebrand factor type A (vWA) domain
MENLDPQQTLLQLFLALRRRNRQLGIRELLDAVRAVEAGVIETADDLGKLLGMLWSHSPEEAREFELIWQSLEQTDAAQRAKRKEPLDTIPPVVDRAPDQEPAPENTAPEPTVERPPTPEWTALPVRAPFFYEQSESAAGLDAYWPVSRRYLVYAWRYLRRPVADGPADVLDLDATVEKAAREGFFLGPVHSRRVRSQARLMLLVDQDGSMVPFHRFTRELVETASEESAIGQVDVFYFHNFFVETVYADPFLNERVAVNDMLGRCDEETSVLIVSDAGAARGFRRLERISSTTKMLGRLKLRTRLLAWLNPMPQERWEGTSAQMISRVARMFQMNSDGCSAALDVVRGLS